MANFVFSSSQFRLQAVPVNDETCVCHSGGIPSVMADIAAAGRNYELSVSNLTKHYVSVNNIFPQKNRLFLFANRMTLAAK